MSRRSWFLIALSGLALMTIAAGARALNEIYYFSASGGSLSELTPFSRDLIDLSLLAGIATMVVGFGAAFLTRAARPSAPLPYISATSPVRKSAESGIFDAPAQ